MAAMFSKPKKPASGNSLQPTEANLTPVSPLPVSPLPAIPNLGQAGGGVGQPGQMPPAFQFNPPKGNNQNDLLLQLLNQFRV